MIQDLLMQFDAIMSLPDSCKLLLLRYITEQEFEKEDTILKFGHVCGHLYFVKRGLVCGSVLYRGQEIAMRFCKEGDMCIVPGSFYAQAPSNESLRALEPSVLYGISFEAVQDICRNFPEFRIIIEHYLRQNYLNAEKCLYMLRMWDRWGRYKYQSETMADIAERVPVKMFCSYIGMMPSLLDIIKNRRFRPVQEIIRELFNLGIWRLSVYKQRLFMPSLTRWCSA